MKKHFLTIGLAVLLAVFGLASCKFSHPGPQIIYGDHDSGGSGGHDAGSNNGGSNNGGNGNGNGNGNGGGNDGCDGHDSHGGDKGNGHGGNNGKGNGHGKGRAASGYNGLIQLAAFGEITGNNPSLFNYKAKGTKPFKNRE